MLAPLELTYPQFVVMMSLWQKDHISVTELANTVGLSKSTMTPLLTRLALLKYITKEFEAGNDRQKCIALTKLGQSHAKEANKAAEKALCATGLNNDEAQQLISLCNKVKTNLTNLKIKK
ncbi:MAG: MarR family winged helix-turn-helix transcriptional regulator [Methylophilaceae bacterium]